MRNGRRVTAGIALARTWEGARTYLLGSGLIYIVLFAYGLIVSASSDANFVPINMADDWLHLVLGIGLLGGWYVSRTGDEIAMDQAAPSRS